MAVDARQERAVTLPDVLKAAAGYLAEYPAKLTAIAAEETYLQYDVSGGDIRSTQRLTGDVVMAGLADGIETFRDVVAVDDAPFRARDDRLVALLREITPESLEQARAWTRGSIERYISPNLHALDQPTAALQFLRQEHQDRSAFRIERVRKMDGAQVAIVRFTERATPRLVRTPAGGPAEGRAWIDVASGAVRQTEIGITDDVFVMRASVKFAREPALGLWLPAEMIQQFDASGHWSGSPSGRPGSAAGFAVRQALEGRARYAKYRRIVSGQAPAATAARRTATRGGSPRPRAPRSSPRSATP
jgi:hypothetical protein